MATEIKPNQCEAVHNGQRCVQQAGVDHHMLRRTEDTGLGLPLLVHVSSTGKNWTVRDDA